MGFKRGVRFDGALEMVQTVAALIFKWWNSGMVTEIMKMGFKSLESGIQICWHSVGLVSSWPRAILCKSIDT